MSKIIISGYVPGAIGRVVALHAKYYSAVWEFGLFFEAKVAAELSEFMRHFDKSRDGFWIISQDERVEGGIAIDGTEAEG